MQSEVMKHMENLLEQTLSYGYDDQIADIEVRMNGKQLQLVSVEIYDEETAVLSNEIIKLREEKTQINLVIAEDRGRQLKKEELIAFLKEKIAELDEFDHTLVRRLIEKVTVHQSGKFTIEFKSGTMVEM